FDVIVFLLPELHAVFVLDIGHAAPGRVAHHALLGLGHRHVRIPLLELCAVPIAGEDAVDQLFGDLDVAIMVDADLADEIRFLEVLENAHDISFRLLPGSPAAIDGIDAARAVTRFFRDQEFHDPEQFIHVHHAPHGGVPAIKRLEFLALPMLDSARRHAVDSYARRKVHGQVAGKLDHACLGHAVSDVLFIVPVELPAGRYQAVGGGEVDDAAFRVVAGEPGAPRNKGGEAEVQ